MKLVEHGKLSRWINPVQRTESQTSEHRSSIQVPRFIHDYAAHGKGGVTIFSRLEHVEDLLLSSLGNAEHRPGARSPEGCAIEVSGFIQNKIRRGKQPVRAMETEQDALVTRRVHLENRAVIISPAVFCCAI